MPKYETIALLAIGEVSQYVGIARSSVFELVREDKFPRPRKIGKRSRWLRAEVDQWISELEEAA